MEPALTATAPLPTLVPEFEASATCTVTVTVSLVVAVPAGEVLTIAVVVLSATTGTEVITCDSAVDVEPPRQLRHRRTG